MNANFAAMPPPVFDRLTELYCDFAMHLISIPEFRAWSPPAVQWLADRVLTGLPDVRAYDKRPIPDHDINDVYPPVLRRVYLALSYALCNKRTNSCIDTNCRYTRASPKSTRCTLNSPNWKR